MSIIAFPTTLYASRMSWSQVRLDFAFNSAFGSQGMEVGSPLWAVTLSSDRLYEADAGAWKSLLMQLRGQTNQLSLWDFARPAPRGTMRGTMTISTDAAQGATSLVIVATGENSKTLLAGDLIGLGSGTTQQVVMVTSDATSHVSTGVITVTIEPPLRNAFVATSAVTWDKPKALFRRTQSKAGWDYESVFASGFSLDLIEDTRP